MTARYKNRIYSNNVNKVKPDLLNNKDCMSIINI